MTDIEQGIHDHPPIPPNDSRFRNDEDCEGWWFETPTQIYCSTESEYCDGILLNGCRDEWNVIIAAVAEVGWIKEAQRRRDAREASHYRILPDGSLEDSFCADAVLAWRKWGERK